MVEMSDQDRFRPYDFNTGREMVIVQKPVMSSPRKDNKRNASKNSATTDKNKKSIANTNVTRLATETVEKLGMQTAEMKFALKDNSLADDKKTRHKSRRSGNRMSSKSSRRKSYTKSRSKSDSKSHRTTKGKVNTPNDKSAPKSNKKVIRFGNKLITKPPPKFSDKWGIRFTNRWCNKQPERWVYKGPTNRIFRLPEKRFNKLADKPGLKFSEKWSNKLAIHRYPRKMVQKSAFRGSNRSSKPNEKIEVELNSKANQEVTIAPIAKSRKNYEKPETDELNEKRERKKIDRTLYIPSDRSIEELQPPITSSNSSQMMFNIETTELGTPFNENSTTKFDRESSPFEANVFRSRTPADSPGDITTTSRRTSATKANRSHRQVPDQTAALPSTSSAERLVKAPRRDDVESRTIGVVDATVAQLSRVRYLPAPVQSLAADLRHADYVRGADGTPVIAEFTPFGLQRVEALPLPADSVAAAPNGPPKSEKRLPACNYAARTYSPIDENSDSDAEVSASKRKAKREVATSSNQLRRGDPVSALYNEREMRFRVAPEQISCGDGDYKRRQRYDRKRFAEFASGKKRLTMEDLETVVKKVNATKPTIPREYALKCQKLDKLADLKIQLQAQEKRRIKDALLRSRMKKRGGDLNLARNSSLSSVGRRNIRKASSDLKARENFTTKSETRVKKPSRDDLLSEKDRKTSLPTPNKKITYSIRFYLSIRYFLLIYITNNYMMVNLYELLIR